MGTLEDVQDRDRVTQTAIARVTEAVKRDTFHPTDQGLSDIHMAVDMAKSAVREEMAGLRKVLQKLVDLDTETKLRMEERERRPPPDLADLLFPLPPSPPSTGLARARGPAIALPGRPIPMGEPTRPPPEAFGRYAAPPPPSDLDERREEWRRKHGLE